MGLTLTQTRKVCSDPETTDEAFKEYSRAISKQYGESLLCIAICLIRQLTLDGEKVEEFVVQDHLSVTDKLWNTILMDLEEHAPEFFAMVILSGESSTIH